ncbi:MAG: helix-turn-helix transcriptional regulator [Sphaerochaetaceae bacterium]|nr:helix-turn-helix transcriptional regulator [Sphaerochaetaceae bacterium]MDD4258934.1 helix-turn-helix transcriptional regulator [Sphaerochaetaceae bacterium]MDD4840695.1 helix-turn-helix transcriptional regulator [Sphaerochaetaceae bacterium]NLO61147.1 helix-turn-helix transcriptional regulator [Spirochaetales bacterium]
MEIVAFWLNIVGFSLLFGTFFLTLVSRKTNRHIMFDQYLWYIGLSWMWFLFQFIGFVYLTVLKREARSILTVNTLIRYAFTIMVFHRIPLFLDTIITGAISKDSKKISVIVGCGTLGLLIFLGFLRSVVIGPYVTVLFNALVGSSFLYAFARIRQQQSYRAKRMRSFLVISSVAFLFFSWYAIIFNVFPNLHRPGFDPFVSAVYIIVWCLNDAMIYLREFSSIGIRERNQMDNFHDRYKLSEREQEIVRLLVDGMSYKEIAFQLSLSPRTVETHIYRIFKKCSVSTKLELINKMFPLRNPT